MKRRIFLAIDLPPELKEQIGETIKQWRWLPIRWLKPENWHITLIPPVYLEDTEFDALTAMLERVRLGGPFGVRFLRVILAPPGIPARMVWLEGGTPQELLRLKKKIEAAWGSLPAGRQAPAGLPPPKPETRPLALHVTLARFEAGELKELESKTRVLGEVDFAFEAKEVVVMGSRLKPSGAEYERLAMVSLQP